MDARVELWFEFASTYSYPAVARIEREAEARGVGVTWCPFLLGPIFRSQGWDDSPFNLLPAKGRYMWRDLERICGALELPFRRPSVFPRNGLHAARVAHRFREEEWCPAFVRGVYRANFVEDRDIADPEVLGGLLAELGRPADAVLEESTTPEAKDGLRRATERAVERGVFGAPSFCVGDELFWGNDRLEDALEWARRGAA